MYRTTFDKEKKQWNGPKIDSVKNPKISLGNVILNALKTNGSRIAQVISKVECNKISILTDNINFFMQVCANTNATTTFNELYGQTIRVASNLQALGCQKGEVVFFLTNNTADIPAIIFASLWLGCPVTALGTFNTELERFSFLKITQPKYVFCDLDEYGQLKECFKNLHYEPKFFTFGGQIGVSRSIESLFKVDDTNAILNFM